MYTKVLWQITKYIFAQYLLCLKANHFKVIKFYDIMIQLFNIKNGIIILNHESHIDKM